jgi:hypothetical protein
MKLSSGVLLAALVFTCLPTDVLAFGPPADQVEEPALQCDVTLFSKTLSSSKGCGQVSLTQRHHLYAGVGECPGVAVHFASTNTKSGTRAWTLSVGSPSGPTSGPTSGPISGLTLGAPTGGAQMEEASCVSFINAPPQEFTFRANVSDGTVQLNCRTQNW